MRDWKKFENEERLIKDLCQKLVNEIRRLESIGDSLGISLEDTKELLDHLYTAKCDEKPVERPEDNSPKDWYGSTCMITGSVVEVSDLEEGVSMSHLTLSNDLRLLIQQAWKDDKLQ